MVTHRIAWIDSAKGVAILMIAIYHTLLFLQPYDLVAPGWLLVRDLFAAFPLPMFFLASGLLARRVLAGSWRDLGRRTLLPLLWLFVVWRLLRFCWFIAVPLSSRPGETSVSALLLSPLLPQSGLWYLHALAGAFVLCRLMRGRVPPALQIGAALALSVAAFGPLNTGNIAYEGLSHYLVFFLVGVHAGRRLVSGVKRAPVFAAPVAIATFVAGVVAVRLLSLQWLPVVPVVLSALAVAAGVLTLRSAVPLARAVGLEAVGRLSLPIYVTHVIIIGAVTRMLLAVLPPDPSSTLQIWLPVVVALVAVAGSLVLAFLLGRTRLRWLYRVPTRWSTRVDGFDDSRGRMAA